MEGSLVYLQRQVGERCSMCLFSARVLSWTILDAYGGLTVILRVSFIERICFIRCEAVRSCRDVVKLLVRNAGWSYLDGSNWAWWVTLESSSGHWAGFRAANFGCWKRSDMHKADEHFMVRVVDVDSRRPAYLWQLSVFHSKVLYHYLLYSWDPPAHYPSDTRAPVLRSLYYLLYPLRIHKLFRLRWEKSSLTEGPKWDAYRFR